MSPLARAKAQPALGYGRGLRCPFVFLPLPGFLSLLPAPCSLGGTSLSSVLSFGSQAISQLREKPILHLLFSVWALVGCTDVNGEREKYCGPPGGVGTAGMLCPLSDVVSGLGASVEVTAPPVGASVLWPTAWPGQKVQGGPWT